MNVHNTSCVATVNAQEMKLTKFDLTSFTGGPLKWTAFTDPAVDLQDSLTAVEKFTNLKRQLEESASDCIQGFSLTSKNYEEAKKVLEE